MEQHATPEIPIMIYVMGSLVILVILTFLGVFFLSDREGRKLRQQRFDLYIHRKNSQNSDGKDVRSEMRKRQVNNKIKALRDSKKHSKSRYGAAQVYLIRAGVDISLTQYWLLSMVLGLVATGIYFLLGYPPLLAPVVFLLFTYIVPRKILNRMATKRQKLFTKSFSDAVDVLVRGLKSGLPVGECFRIIAKESPDPVGSEFRIVLEEHHAGLTMEEALERCYERMPTQELRFFATVIAIQAQTGGNLAEILSNISAVLRGRAQLKEKIKALAGEARASSMIIGSLPFVIATLLFFVNRDYIMLLWTTRPGNIVLGGAAFMMFMGVWIMNKMGQLDM